MLVKDQFTELKNRFKKHLTFHKELDGVVQGLQGAGLNRFNNVIAQRYAFGIGHFLTQNSDALVEIINMGKVTIPNTNNQL